MMASFRLWRQPNLLSFFDLVTESLTFTAGTLRVPCFSISGSALWDFTDSWQAGVSLSRAARAPSTEELFSNVEAADAEELVTHAATGVIEIGDPDLDVAVGLLFGRRRPLGVLRGE